MQLSCNRNIRYQKFLPQFKILYEIYYLSYKDAVWRKMLLTIKNFLETYVNNYFQILIHLPCFQLALFSDFKDLYFLMLWQRKGNSHSCNTSQLSFVYDNIKNNPNIRRNACLKTKLQICGAIYDRSLEVIFFHMLKENL